MTVVVNREHISISERHDRSFTITGALAWN